MHFIKGDYDNPNDESAAVKLDSDILYTLAMASDSSAVWTGLIQPTLVSPAVVGMGAMWKLMDLFAGVSVKSIILYPTSAAPARTSGS